jgi:hypothetical protein
LIASRPVAALVAALACVAGADLGRAQPYANYSCGDGQKLTVVNERGGTVLVMTGGGAVRLWKRGPSYASAGGELRGDGGVVTFRMAGRAATSCRLVERGPA